MLDFSFEVISGDPVLYSASPLLNLRTAITANEPIPVHSILLRCQIMMEVMRRHYTDEEQTGLKDLFGEPERWGQTLRTMLWTHVSVVVPPFREQTSVDLPVPCTFDFNVAATKYFGALQSDDIPLLLLFSGTVFYEGENGALQVCQISWEREAKFRLQVKVWRAMMEHYYPNSSWLCLRRDVFEKLYQFKVRNGIPTWEQTLEGIIPS